MTQHIKYSLHLSFEGSEQDAWEALAFLRDHLPSLDDVKAHAPSQPTTRVSDRVSLHTDA